jgi:hypothetical protein
MDDRCPTGYRPSFKEIADLDSNTCIETYSYYLVVSSYHRNKISVVSGSYNKCMEICAFFWFM